ncbi:hypothetical protein [Streptosporangium sp. NPDC002721]|uniref:hypothetical protein n=1 Tax=Streptosporangium sp. NPDC002721 TaxID=3366188 RepID=UPI0036BC2017
MRDLQGWGGQLVELAWELNELGVDSVVRLPPDGPASMEIFLSPGGQRPVAEQHRRASACAWDRRHERKPRTKARVTCERITRGTR